MIKVARLSFIKILTNQAIAIPRQRRKKLVAHFLCYTINLQVYVPTSSKVDSISPDIDPIGNEM